MRLLSASFEIGSADWQTRVQAIKFAEWPAFATVRRGRIGLQELAIGWLATSESG